MRRELIGFGIYVFIDKTAGAVKFRLDDIVIGTTFGLGPIAHFNIATKLNGYFFDVMARLVPVPTSIYTRYHGKGEHQQIRDKFFVLARINIIFGILGTGAALTFAWPFITLWGNRALRGKRSARAFAHDLKNEVPV